MNPWALHIKNTQKKNPALMFKDVLKLAGKTYKKSAKAIGSIIPTKKVAKKSKKAKKVSKKAKKSRKAKKSKKSKK